MKFFTSDPHFYHKNVIKYSNRPFENVEEMNQILIKNINAKVGETDELYFLGDFIFGSTNKAIEVLSQIKCKNLHYIFGNHDETMYDPKLLQFFKSMQSYLEVVVPDSETERGKQMICLFHYPIAEWNKGHRGSWMLHGHCHGNFKYPEMLKNKRILDVGVDVHNYAPVSYDEIKNLFKNCTDIKHHGD